MSLSWPAAPGTAINITVNTLGDLGNGAFTVLVLTKPAGNHGHFGAKVSSSFNIQQLNDSNIFFGAGDFSGFGTSNSTDWHLVGHSKASGSNVYRWHYWNYSAGGAKTHTDGTGTHANPGTITAIQIGNSDNRGNGLIAVVAVWKRVLSDAEFDSLCTTNLSDWMAVSGGEPDGLWALNVAAASVVDGTGNGNNASSVDGTITAGADPPGFDYDLVTIVPLAGTADATSTATAIARVRVHAAGAADAVSTTAAIARVRVHAAGTADAVSTTSGAARVRVRVSGAAAAVSTATLTVITDLALAAVLKTASIIRYLKTSSRS